MAGVSAGNAVQHLYELVVAVVEGKLEQEGFFMGLEEEADVQQDILAHIFWVLFMQYEPKAECVERLVQLVTASMRKEKVTWRLLLETQEVELLVAAGIVADGDEFRRREMRTYTRMVYKQTKFNMMREESEGYAKLLTLLNLSPPSAATMPALAGEIKSLIGFFDLDPNRVLDLVLDAAEHWSGDRDWLQLMPLFNESAAAELMAFKFLYHQREDVPPAGEGLYEVAALLVQAGHVKLENILHYLTPCDEEAQKVQVEALQLVQAKVDAIGRMDLATPEADRPAGDNRRPGHDGAALELDAAQYDQQLAALGGDSRRAQKLRLVEGFLKIQDWDHAKLLMRWLQTMHIQPASDRSLRTTLASSLATRIQPIHHAMHPYGSLAGNIVDKMAQLTEGQQGGRAEASAAAPTVHGPPLDDKVFELLDHLGLELAGDPSLFAKVVCVLRHHVAFFGTVPAHATGAEVAFAHKEMAKVERAISASIIPALQMMPANHAMEAEVWSLLIMLPYNKRYQLYREVMVATEEQPLMLAAARMAMEKVKKVFRRVHMPQDRRDLKEALEPYGRELAEIMHANPLAVSQEVVRQAMSHPSQIASLVETLKHISPMAYDVLTLAIITQLGNKAHSKLKEDGTGVQEWLQALAKFSGSVCNHCHGMEINAICQYVKDSVRGGDPLDLLVLKELLEQMASMCDVAPDKVSDLAGGEILRQEAQAAGTGLKSQTLQSGGRRLLEALQKGSPRQHLAMPLLILLSQQLDQIAINTDSPHLKFIAELYDTCHETCLQYLEFLRSVLPLEQYTAMVLPLPLEVLISRYGMRPEIALTLWRPVMCALEHQAKSMADEGELSDDVAAAGLHKMDVGDEEEDGDVSWLAGTKPVPPVPAAPCGTGGPALPISWKDLMDSICKCQPEMWTSLSPELYATFWNLTLYDISFPKDRYDVLMDRLKRKMQDQDSEARPPEDTAAERDVVHGHKRQKQRVQETLERLQQECEAQRKRSAEVQARLERESSTWLPNQKTSVGAVVNSFIQNLIVPRVMMSPADALFCSRFALKMHQLGTPRWSTPLYYDRVVRSIAKLLRCATEHEAVCLGIFLADTLELVGRWRSSPEVYAAEAESKPTFVVSWELGQEHIKTSFVQFQRLAWEGQMDLTKVVLLLLDCGEDVQIRIALLVLAKIVHVFPAKSSTAATLSRKVKDTFAKARREDIKQMAACYDALLSKELKVSGRMMGQEQEQEHGGGGPVVPAAEVAVDIGRQLRQKTKRGGEKKHSK